MSLVATRIPYDALGRRPRSYDDLCRLAARYAQEHLAGLTVVNQATQLSIALTSDALGAATRLGAPPAVLWAIPALPSLLSVAGYIRSTPDRRRHTDMQSASLVDTRRAHLFAAAADIAGKPVELLFRVRENFGGQGFLDRVITPATSDRRRQDGGGTPENAGAPGTADPDDADSAPEPGHVPVTVNDFHDEVFGLGHVGIAVGNDPSEGFYPGSEWITRYGPEVLGISIPGKVKLDDTSQPHYAVELDTTPDAASKIMSYIKNRAANPGLYELYLRQCTDFVRSALAAGDIGTYGNGVLSNPWTKYVPNAWFKEMFRDQYNKGNVPQE